MIRSTGFQPVRRPPPRFGTCGYCFPDRDPSSSKISPARSSLTANGPDFQGPFAFPLHISRPAPLCIPLCESCASRVHPCGLPAYAARPHPHAAAARRGPPQFSAARALHPQPSPHATTPAIALSRNVFRLLRRNFTASTATAVFNCSSKRVTVPRCRKAQP